jgi:hypothetical protein
MKYKMYHLFYHIHVHHAVSLVLLTLLLSVAGCKSSGLKNTAQPASAAKPSSAPSKRLTKEGGWKIPGLAIAKEFRPPTLLPSAGNESVKVYTSSLRPPFGPPGPVTLKDYLSDEELKELGITTNKPMVMTIVKFDQGDHPFCYVIKYRSIYTMEGLHYYDEDGDQDFELLETGTALPQFIPRIPSWVQAAK